MAFGTTYATLKNGSSGSAVLKLQNYLNKNGYKLSEDGVFGNNTLTAVKDFQKKNGLAVDGIVGDKTWGALTGGSGGSGASSSGATAAPTISAAPTQPTFNTQATAQPTTDTTSWDDTSKGQAALKDYNTAKENVDKNGNFTYEDYMESEAVKGANDALNAHLTNKPGEYNSQWQAQLDALMNSIMNREKFSYDFNEDALYQQYKDKYIQQGKMAMADTMGQAAAMTGGYGSSYAQSVGQQAYQGQLDNLNDIVPELYQMALDRYNQEGQDLYNQYGMVMDRENTDYGRYRDTVSDFLTERDYLQGRYDTERGFDYGKYIDDRNLDYTLHQEGYQRLLDSLGIAQSDYYSGGDVYRTEQSIKNEDAWNKYQASEDARQYANSLLQQGYQNEFGEWEANSENAWQQAQWDEAARQYANEEAWRQKEWDFAQQQYADSKVSLENIPGINTTDASWFDENGNFKKAEYKGLTADGKAAYRIDGKVVIYDVGVNPYTQTVNPDTKHGTFPTTPYQPNNINSEPLSKTGIKDYMNGILQNVWQTPDGKKWIWDGTQNKYEEYIE